MATAARRPGSPGERTARVFLIGAGEEETAAAKKRRRSLCRLKAAKSRPQGPRAQSGAVEIESGVAVQ